MCYYYYDYLCIYSMSHSYSHVSSHDIGTQVGVSEYVAPHLDTDHRYNRNPTTLKHLCLYDTTNPHPTASTLYDSASGWQLGTEYRFYIAPHFPRATLDSKSTEEEKGMIGCRFRSRGFVLVGGLTYV